MADVICREYRPEDGPGYLRVHAQAFPPLTLDYWERWTRVPTTASIALLDDEVVGAVPFVFRDLVVRPGVVVRVAWEYSVCVAARMRDTGIGSKLMTEAKRFLPGRCVAMMVYRNTERSAGYRYYARNGHHDLLYARAWRRAPSASGFPEGVRTRPSGRRSCVTRRAIERGTSKPMRSMVARRCGYRAFTGRRWTQPSTMRCR